VEAFCEGGTSAVPAHEEHTRKTAAIPNRRDSDSSVGWGQPLLTLRHPWINDQSGTGACPPELCEGGTSAVPAHEWRTRKTTAIPNRRDSDSSVGWGQPLLTLRHPWINDQSGTGACPPELCEGGTSAVPAHEGRTRKTSAIPNRRDSDSSVGWGQPLLTLRHPWINDQSGTADLSGSRA